MSVYESSITNPKKQLEFYKDLSEQLQRENQQLKEMHKTMARYALDNEAKIDELNYRIDKAINKVQYIIDYGFDYDGFNQVDSLKGLIDMLVDYARQTKKILKGEENE